MQLDFTTIIPAEAYRWLASTITLRSIAWVSTLSAEGASSLISSSFFQVISDELPALTVDVSLRDDGSLRDILRNVQAAEQLVIHLVGAAQAETMNATSAWLPHDVGEIETVDILTVPSVRMAPPWIAVAAAAFECEATEIKPYPVENPNCHLTFARVLLVYVNDAVLADERHVDSDRFDLVGRLDGSHYNYIRDAFGTIRSG